MKIRDMKFEGRSFTSPISLDEINELAEKIFVSMREAREQKTEAVVPESLVPLPSRWIDEGEEE